MLFTWLIMLALAVLSVLWVVRAILKQQRTLSYAQSSSRDFFEVRKLEIQEELLSGRISEAENAQLIQDLAMEVDYIDRQRERDINEAMALPRVALSASVALVLVGSVVLYQQIGFAPDITFTQKMLNQTADDKDISEFLHYRVSRYDRAEDWYYLASEQLLAQNYIEAIASYRQVLQKLDSDSPDRVNVQVELAQAMFYANNNTVSESMREVVVDALKADPNHVKALGLQGIIDFDQGAYKAAILNWQSAIRLGSDRRERLDLLSGIAAARKQGNISESEVPSLVTHRLQLKLAFNPELLSEQDVFLVYAKALNQPMPIAIQKLTKAEIMAPIVLTNIDNLMPGKSLSDELVVDVVVKRTQNGAADLTQGTIIGELSNLPSNSDKIFTINLSL